MTRSVTDLVMKQLEFSAFITLIAILFGGHYFFRSAQTEIGRRSTTYVPEASLSDGESWQAWQDTVGKSVSTETYVKNSRPSSGTIPSTTASSSSSKPKSDVNLEQMRQNSDPRASERAGGSFASSIVLDRADALPSENAASIARPNLTEGNTIEDPNLLPNLLSLGVFSADEANDLSLDSPQRSQTRSVSNLRDTSNLQKTVVSVPVALQAEASESVTTLDKTSASSDLFSPDRVLWISLLVTSACGSIGLGKYLFPKYYSHKQDSPSPNQPPPAHSSQSLQ
ncbi:hypothetical protein IQ235_06975 [Oscillatoriales cyanobacterium LEGE 11467]|uniref:Uncharacterized protein n=1 Tax=Zarconia navalis LEGE 11467 TaxID=1828826 RepID=A0A928VVY8_9CYAN|nr:hypothetical protein [Zarconia navalis]MBE9040529.1 hypothetical protein [Zarconia navalis LEGE 11467]